MSEISKPKHDNCGCKEELENNSQIDFISFGLEKFATIGQLSAGIIHEINQPLHSIQTIIDGIKYLDSTGEKLSYEELLTDIEKISNRISRISDIINSMRCLMNVNEGIKISKIDINREIEKTILLKNFALKNNKINIKTDFQTPSICLNFSIIQFQQIIINLINNSMDSLIKTKNKTKNILISTAQIDKKVIIKISDNGNGIASENLEQIFSPFYSTNSSNKNSGLGLFIIKQILSCYNGHITCQNNEDCGALFTIEIGE